MTGKGKEKRGFEGLERRRPATQWLWTWLGFVGACRQAHHSLPSTLPHVVGKCPRMNRGYTPQQVTRGRAYLNETSVSNPENLRNCEGLGEGAGVKGHRAFYCS